jgi:hypothetical protein
MKARTIALTLALCSTGVAAGAVSSDPNLGTWKLNAAKSKLVPGTPKNDTVVYEAVGDNVKITVDGTDGAGKPAHNEWTGKFDGKNYPVTGDSTADARSYTRVDERTLTFANSLSGKVTLSGRIVVSADGKSRTVTVSGTDATGTKVTSTSVFDKQ